MSRFRILKELKKSLKRKRRHVWSLGLVAALFLLAAIAGSWMAHRIVAQKPSQVFLPIESASAWAEEPGLARHPTSRDRTLSALQRWHGQVELILHRTYLCGEETRQLGRLSSSEASDLLKSHREWEASFDSAGKMLMEESIDDLSPQCRKTAYIGMDGDGNLTLFDGPPWQEKAIRTFFQLDVEMLESRMSDDRLRDLANGIRVTDKDEYNSVLSSFDEYAIMKSQAAPQ
ncbi:BofC C-terminal domain-containing protein [Cohnella cholangitidis]|uniref:Bypass of forespore C C-terminal domain-containing protein n=1 Tax=Cohnella cholangitidis TaxID=2598458 RepID=A0A7G5C3P2_9BACL|nr:BofC C-terminal domain-containing protein [Cohnella cholangitidis]QMV43826.1 hypothetical protein FPL14_23630 [Cohnella cholangitidis]